MQMYLNSNSSKSGKISLEDGLGLSSMPWQSLSSDSRDLQMVFLHLGPTSSHLPIYLARSPPPPYKAFPGGSESIRKARQLGSVLGWKDPLEKGMATHSSSLV